MIYFLENRKLSGSFPKDEEFIKGFTNKNVYAMRGKNKMYIFERLENGSSKEKNDVVANIESGTLTIEHIMPQTLSAVWKQALGENYEQIQEHWLHTIANLTLSGYNYAYSNRPFLEKKNMDNGFAQSGLRLNQYIAKFDQWTEAELKKRQKKLSQMALSIWSYPTTTFELQKREDEVVSLSEDNGTCTGRKIAYYMFQDTRYNATDWVDMLWGVAEILFSLNPSILYQEASNPKNVWFGTSAVDKHYKKLSESLYFCPTKSSTWNKMAILKNLFKLYQIDEDELLFGLVPNREDEDFVE